eukprot:m.361384 g.361384  ORF g.361384 m.361384 type:complete len:576 (+) comp19562_c0_seq1:294-2021(+)
MAEGRPVQTEFSNSGEDVIHRTVEGPCPVGEGVDQLASASEAKKIQFFELDRCISEISAASCKRVALQMPDEYLAHAGFIASHLRSHTDAECFILGDTTYGSCCIDEVAAEHVGADLIIHFGHSCLSRPDRTQTLFVFGKASLSVEALQDSVATLADAVRVCIIITPGYAHAQASVEAAFKAQDKVHVMGVDDAFLSSVMPPSSTRDQEPSLLAKGTQEDADEREQGDSATKDTETQQKQDTSDANNRRFGRNLPDFLATPQGYQVEDVTFIFVGDSTSRSLVNFMQFYSRCQMYVFKPDTNELELQTVNVNRQLMKRYFLIQKAKDAQTIGLLVGTLGSADYYGMLRRLQALVRASGKKDYTMLVGKINPAKLANFAEVDLYCLVACAENSLVDSTEYFKPVITPFELEMACSPDREWQGYFEADYTQLLSEVDADLRKLMLEGSGDAEGADGEQQEPHFSLLTGSYVKHDKKQELVEDESGAIVARNTTSTVAEYGRGFLSSRTFQGLEQRLGETPVAKAVKGRKGIAISYDGEPDLDEPSSDEDGEEEQDVGGPADEDSDDELFGNDFTKTS